MAVCHLEFSTSSVEAVQQKNTSGSSDSLRLATRRRMKGCGTSTRVKLRARQPTGCREEPTSARLRSQCSETIMNDPNVSQWKPKRQQGRAGRHFSNTLDQRHDRLLPLTGEAIAISVYTLHMLR